MKTHLLTLAEAAEILGVPLQDAVIRLQQGKFPAPDLQYLNGREGRPYYAPRWHRDRIERLASLEQAKP